jgi:serine/threonine protein phosphatase PrpC
MSAVAKVNELGLDAPLLVGRYRIMELISQRCGVERYLAEDVSAHPPAYVQLVRESSPTDGEPALPADGSVWPSLAWEERLRHRCRHIGLPKVVQRFNDAGHAYLAIELPSGTNLWDAWDDPTYATADKYGWLIQLADLLQVLHAGGAILESLRPDQVVLASGGQVVLIDSGNLLPLPVPADVPLIRTHSTAPELLTGVWIDARSDLYCFGAMVFALQLGRELTDLDYHSPGVPKHFLERFPDAHPLLGRLLSKTYCPDIQQRFPTSECAADDPGGFRELIGVLEQCQQLLGRVRLNVAAWSTTGMVRSGNEDAFAVLQTSSGRLDELEDYVMAMVADGMGGNEAGEVAAGLAVRSLYQSLGQQPPFNKLPLDPENSPPPTFDSIKKRINEALREANKSVYLASRQGIGRRGMGCTAEVVFTDGRRVMVGHVGDSRTYRFSRGKFTLITRDHTYVNRLVELGEISEEEAETHPRRAELQQAIGGWSDIEPEIHDVPIEPGDWILICSDGLTNQLKMSVIQELLERATSAESAARQLVNMTNLTGATDNVTVIVIHAV